MTHITTLLQRILVHRRLLATLAAMVCVLAVCTIATGHDGPTTTVYTAVARIPPGTTVTASQVTKTVVPADVVPEDAVTSLDALGGQMTAGPVPAGAIVTMDDFVSASQAADGFVILPLAVSSQILSVIEPGEHVSIFLTNASTGEVTVARGIRVVTVPAATSSGMFSSSGSADSILVEVPEDVAKQMTTSSSLGSTTVAIE